MHGYKSFKQRYNGKSSKKPLQFYLFIYIYHGMPMVMQMCMGG